MDETVIIRDFKLSDDQAFIYSSWQYSSYFDVIKQPDIPYSRYRVEQSRKIRDILGNAQVKIACLKAAPSVIVGYSVYTNTHLDWIYVKIDYRNTGIGALLAPKDLETVTGHLTKIGKAIVEKKNLKVKENDNGNEESNHNGRNNNPRN